MKNLKIVIVGLILGLPGSAIRGMESAQISQCSLGSVEFRNVSEGQVELYNIPANSNEISQSLSLDGKPIGFLDYVDLIQDGTCSRILTHIIIFDNPLRGRGLGSGALRQFIEQSRDEGITKIRLQGYGRAEQWYQRFGFVRVKYEMELDLQPTHPYHPLHVPSSKKSK